MATATYQVTPPEAFSFNTPTEWTKWIRRLERFRSASGLSDRTAITQVNTLIYTMGPEADDIFHSFTLSEDEKGDYDVVKGKFNSHFVKRTNVIYERAMFNRRIQEEGKAVDVFITALYAQAEKCAYGALKEEMIRDKIVVGIRDTGLSLKLQLDPDLTLQKAVTQTREAESVKSQQSAIRNKEKNVQAVHKGRGPPKKQFQKQSGSKRPDQKLSCYRCGKSPLHDRQQCPAKEAECRSCGKRGHYQAVCRTKNIGKVHHEEYDSDEDSDEEVFLGAVHSKGDNQWTISIELNGKPTEFQIDTGAEASLIPEEVYKKIGSPTLSKVHQIFRGPNNAVIPVMGHFMGKLKHKRNKFEQEMYVVKRLHKPLLGQPAIQALGLVKRIEEVQVEKQSQIEQHPSLFTGLGKLQGEYTIKLQDGAKPYALTTPRRVPIPLKKRVKAELDRMVSQGVIQKIQEPTDWCAGMVVAPKSNGKVRICVDLTRLNNSVCRERHPLPSVDQVLGQLAGAKVFSKLDANSGFWQIPLSPESIPLTTFITPFGRFCFHRLPFGITSAPEHFQRRMSELVGDKDGVVCLIDDILIHGQTQEEHDKRLSEVLRKLQEAGLTLNKEKCEFSKTRVSFLGHIVDESGVRADPDKIQAIQNISAPTSVSEVRRFLGTVNQMSKFAPNLAGEMKPLRDLLIKGNHWTWEAPQQKAFTTIKQRLTTSPVLAFFDPTLKTVVSADASSYGLGATLLQQQLTRELKPVGYVSRSMTPTEQRYAQIEKEALALTWACERFSDYLLGLDFLIQTDHKPLVPLFSVKALEELPIRVQRFRMRMLRYRFNIEHIPGKDLVVADMLSRAPTGLPTTEDQQLDQEGDAYIQAVMRSLPASDKVLEEVKQKQELDETCSQIKTYCKEGWPERTALTGAIRPYYSVLSEISVQNGLLMRGNRIIIPSEMRLQMLDKIHQGHQGIEKCRRKARVSVWWPGLAKQLEELVKNCPECYKLQNLRHQPLIPTEFPDLPWQKVGTDMFEWKKENYLMIIDYYSRYMEVEKLKQTTTDEVVLQTKSIFARHGIPEIVVSDNGPQYSSKKYEEFADNYHFQHITASPYHPQSNGEAERAIGTLKSLLKREKDPYSALLAYRTTPLSNGYSPAQLLMNRRLRTKVPVTREMREPKIPTASLRTKEQTLRAKQKDTFDKHYGVRDVPPLDPGTLVWMPDRESEGIVTEEVAPRSYTVETQEGTYRRNRRNLIETPRDRGDDSGDDSEPEQPTRTVRRSHRERREVDRFDPSRN